MNGAWHYQQGDRLLYQAAECEAEDPALYALAVLAQAHYAAALTAVHADATFARNMVSAGNEWRNAMTHDPARCQRVLPDAAGICGNLVKPGDLDCGGHTGAVALTPIAEPDEPLVEPPAAPWHAGWRDETTGLVSGGLVTDDTRGGCPTCGGRWTVSISGRTDTMCGDAYHVEQFGKAVR